jgi:hypothetical protein
MNRTRRQRRVFTRRRTYRGGDRSWYKLPEIPFESYVRCLRPLYQVLEKRNKSKSQPDVFLKTILASHSGMTTEQWSAAELQRLYEKALSMKMGDFHEELMGKFPGYETLPLGHSTGTDVRKTDDTEFIEVKNRDNTMNSGSAETVIRSLTKLAEEGKKSILVLVNSAKKTLPRFKAPRTVEVVSGRQIYAYLSGRDTFYDDLLETLNQTFRRYPTYASLEAEAATPPSPVRV